jgi:response regulator RpfG family c-di-GMP phosphodiesterase/serine/threonine protein kinase
MTQAIRPSALGISANPTRNSVVAPATMVLEDRALLQQVIDELLHCNLVLPAEWHGLEEAQRDSVLAAHDQNDLIDRLEQRGLLTQYQSARVKAGTVYGLVLGNYRVLDRVGAGGMGIVFKAEHVLLRKIVALKVLPLSRDQDTRMLRRFLAEMRTVASLQHPNIVAATDAGQVFPAEPNLPVLHYMAMEFVEGRDLEELVAADGAMDPVVACDLIHQVAAALAEAHGRGLIHRDIKPGNIIVTTANQAKLLDFGLARDFTGHMTDPGSLLGTIDYMAPEQAQNPTAVDIRADIYGLGATLYWCLTGKVPFPSQSTLSQQIARRLHEPPPSARARRPEILPELDAVVAKMMAVRPEDRFQTPQAVTRALAPFLRAERSAALAGGAVESMWALSEADAEPVVRRRVLIVDDESSVADYCKAILASDAECTSALNAAEALTACARESYDVVLLDLVLPDTSGRELLKLLRDQPSFRQTRVILMSGYAAPDDLAQMLAGEADDFIPKPFSAVKLRSRVKTVLRLNEALNRIDQLGHHARTLAHDLERAVEGRQADARQARSALIQGLVATYLFRTHRPPAHLVRLQHLARALAEEAMADPELAGAISHPFVQTLEQAVPLFDIGQVALPDHILSKSGAHDPEERIILQSHTTLGADLLRRVADAMGKAGEFLQTAIQIARSHHEQWNGKGYPDRLGGDEIPLAARITALADTYEALRSRRSYQPTLPHEAACEVILEASPGKHDPRLLAAFRRCAAKFDEIHGRISD